MTTAPLFNTPEAAVAAQSLAKAFGLDPAVAQPAIAGLADALSTRMTRNMLSRGGIADIVDLISNPNAAQPLQGASAASSPETIAEGNHVLDVLIGDKHISRGIAARTAATTGVDVNVLKQMLPAVAAMMIGGLQKEAVPQINKIASKVPALAAASNNGSPLPIPGDNIPGVGRQAPPSKNPFDNLPDIIRRGGTPAPGGGSLDEVIRQIIGSLLGNKNRGVVGTIIQGLVLRWIVNFVRRMLTRAPA